MLTSLSRLAHYELQGELGRGGTGIVYAARDLASEQMVALKILNPETANDRPLREIRAAELLDDAGIARIYEASEEGGRRFIAMELVPGQSLETILSKGPLPLSTALDYGVQVLKALETAHAAGVIHRDLKPSNLMVTPEGRVKIVDFGLAKMTSPLSMNASDVTAAAGSTNEGMLSGTLAYMSPEQAEGKRVDSRTDLFSFGAVLVEMLTGQSLFGRENPVSTLVAVMTQEVSRSAEIPETLWPIVARCLDKDALQRWNTAADLRFALERECAAAGPVSVAVVEPVKQRSRREILLWAGGAAMVAGASSYLAARRTGKAVVPVFEQLTFESGEVSTARFAPDGLTFYISWWRTGSEYFYIYEGRVGSRRLRKLELPPATLLDVSIKNELALILLGDQPPTLARVPGDGGPARPLASNAAYGGWSPDGAAMLATRFSGAKMRLEYPLGTVLQEGMTARGLPFAYARLSRDGRKVAYFRPETESRHEELCVMDLKAAGNPVRILSQGWVFTSPLHWTADSKEIWFSGAVGPNKQSSLWASDLRGGLRRVAGAPGQLTLQDFRVADGAALTVSHDTTTAIRVMSPGGVVVELPRGMVVSISDDGSTIMATEPTLGQGHTILVYEKGSRAAIQLGECQNATMSPDGKFVAHTIAPTGGSGQRMLLTPVGVGDVREITQAGFFCEESSWFGDGKRLLVRGSFERQARSSFILSLEDRSFVRLTSPGSWGEIVSRDGKKCLIRNEAGESFVRDLGTGETRNLVVRENLVAATWAVDGESILFQESQPSGPKLTIWRIEVGSGRMTKAMELETRRWIYMVAVTPDARHLAYVPVTTNSTVYLVRGLG